MTDSLPGTPPPPEPPQPPPPRTEPIGALESLSRAWSMLTEDFTNLWLAGLIFTLINFLANALTYIPCVGWVLALASLFLVTPQLYAGLLYVAIRRVDGESVRPGDILEGFRSKFLQSMIAVFPYLALLIFGFGVVAGTISAVSLITDGAVSEGTATLIIFFIMMPVVLLLLVVCLFFLFVPAVIWDLELSAPVLEPVKRSFRLVRDNFWTVLALGALILLILFCASVGGLLLLCIGYFLLYPAAVIWCSLAVAVLYRQWTREKIADVFE